MTTRKLAIVLAAALCLAIPGTGRAFSGPAERSDLWLEGRSEPGFAVEYSVTTGPREACPPHTGDRPLEVTVRSVRPSEHGYRLELSVVVCASLRTGREGWSDSGQPQRLFLVDRAGRRWRIEGRFEVRTQHCASCCACLMGTLRGSFGPRGRRRRARANIIISRGSRP